MEQHYREGHEATRHMQDMEFSYEACNPKVNNLLLDLRVVKYILSPKYKFMKGDHNNNNNNNNL